MSASMLVKALGLNFSPNQLNVPDGSLSKASNVIIRRDDTVESRRGFNLYGNSLGSASDRAKQIMYYRDRLLRHYSDKLEFDSDGNGTFVAFSGSFLEPISGLRIRSTQANGNFYFTSNDGIKKISISNDNQFTYYPGSPTPSGSITTPGFVSSAGGVKAIDLSASLDVTLGNQTGFLPADTTVAYRVVWGLKDNNDNLILGSPSQRAIVYNSLLSLLLQDFNRTLGALDNINQSGSLITDGNYISSLSLPITATSSELYTNLLALSTKLDTDILYADTAAIAPLQIGSASISGGFCTITFSSGDPSTFFDIGSKIYLTGFSPVTGSLAGAQVVTFVDSTTLQFATTAIGAVTLSSAIINCNEFRSITQPTVPILPTPNNQLVELQTYLANILVQLQIFPSTVIPSGLQTVYIAPLQVTTTANVTLNISIPAAITPNYFFQIYRSTLFTATGTTVLADLSPDDELQLVYEAYPTSAELAAKIIEVVDITPDSFRGANLYTNPSTGEGILQSNDLPPFARDINRFKNVIFYSNTKTRNRLNISLLGILRLISDYNSGTIPTLTIANNLNSNTYKFVTGLAQQVTITCNAGNTLNASGTASYFTLNSGNNDKEYYIWYKIGTATDPNISNKIGIPVLATALDTDNDIALKTRNTLTVYNYDFTISGTTNQVIITNNQVGYTSAPSSGTSGFSFSTTPGRGEDASIQQVLLSSSVSPAQAVDETARSLVRVINANTNENIYAYYISGATDVPGKMLFEDRNLSDNAFSLVTNNSNTGSSFSPDISPEVFISTIATGGVTSMLITTSTPHGLINQDQIIITNTNSTPIVDGIYEIIYVSPTTFRIPVVVTVAGNRGAFTKVTNATTSQNEAKSNRIYYSKFQQPEAVPIVNYMDIGSENKAILRIFPLRNSLFIFKEDGVFRISGESAPFTVSLFDSSCILIAPDTLDVSNNLLYCWTSMGISAVSEGGVTPFISRPIDTEILRLASSNFTNFSTLSWGIGYESDNSYTVFTVQSPTDTTATIGYRHSTLTNSWTTVNKSNTCGVILPSVDKMYMGAGDTNYIESERKTFTRLDYSDREISSSIFSGFYYNEIIKLQSVSNIAKGDVLLQEQTVSIYLYNALLQMLDNDAGLSFKDYYSSLKAKAGDDMRSKLLALATKLDIEPNLTIHDYVSTISTKSGSITANNASNPTIITCTNHGLVSNRIINITGSNSAPYINGTYEVTVIDSNTFSIPFSVTVAGTSGLFLTQDANFQDLQACFNVMITKLNLDSGTNFSNYAQITNTTVIETPISDVNYVAKNITTLHTLDFIVGDITIFKAIPCEIIYCPNTMGDPLGLKHLRESTLMFSNKAFTGATLSFATDLLPQFVDIPFSGDGNGTFGLGTGVFGNGFFGGASNSAPFRTYIPRNCQRCRYIVAKFQHQTAREKWAIFGITITGEDTQSSRAYR